MLSAMLSAVLSTQKTPRHTHQTRLWPTMAARGPTLTAMRLLTTSEETSRELTDHCGRVALLSRLSRLAAEERVGQSSEATLILFPLASTHGHVHSHRLTTVCQ